MKFIYLFLFLISASNSYGGGGFDCRQEYKKFIMSTRSWGSEEEYRFFRNHQTKEGKRILASKKFNKSQWLKWRKMLFEKAYALINEAYSRGSTPLVNRIATKGKIPKNYIFNFLKKGNRNKQFCDGRPIDFNTLAFSIVLSYGEKK